MRALIAPALRWKMRPRASRLSGWPPKSEIEIQFGIRQVADRLGNAAKVRT